MITIMKAEVDANICIGCGLCEATCPEVFRLNNDISEVIVDAVPTEAQENCRQAANNCPVQAISLNE